MNWFAEQLVSLLSPLDWFRSPKRSTRTVVVHVAADGTVTSRHPRSDACASCDSAGVEYVPVTFESCRDVTGPFFHGTRVALEVGDELVPGRGSNFQQGRVSNNIYFAGGMDAAVWGAELSTALAGDPGRGHVYVVEPLGPFEDDPNLTNKRFPGNPTQSYRSRHPLRVVSEVVDWEGHPPEVLQNMLDSLAVLRAEGRDLIED